MNRKMAVSISILFSQYFQYFSVKFDSILLILKQFYYMSQPKPLPYRSTLQINPQQPQSDENGPKSIRSLRKMLFSSIVEKPHSPSLDFSTKWRVHENSQESYISSITLNGRENSLILKGKDIHRSQVQQIQNQIIYEPRSKEEINATIRKSNNLIKMIKLQRKELNLSKLRKSKVSLTIKTEGNEEATYLTRPSHLKSSQPHPQQFSYLNRNTLQELSRREITPSQLSSFFKEDQNTKQSMEIEHEARKFLLKRMHSDYQNYGKVAQIKTKLRQQKMKKIIEEKQKLYSKQYGKRISCPYFSFLSLPPIDKKLVLHSQHSKSLKK